jgi:hypothetical protein
VLSTTQLVLICFLVLICSVLSFFAGRSGRKLKIITIKEHDTIEIHEEIPSKLSDFLVEEEAFVPGEDNVK